MDKATSFPVPFVDFIKEGAGSAIENEVSAVAYFVWLFILGMKIFSDEEREIKGTLSREYLRFGVKSMLEMK